MQSRLDWRDPGARLAVAALVMAVWLPVAGVGSAEEVESAEEAVEDPWALFSPLLGTWKGEGSGFGVTSDVEHTWELVLQGNFIRLRTRSVPRGEASGGVHEDVGFLSRDTGADTYVFRQFLTEGFVNTYHVTVGPGEPRTIEFEPHEFESTGGLQARMHLVFASPNEYRMVLDLASPGKEFAACQEMTMVRSNPMPAATPIVMTGMPRAVVLGAFLFGGQPTKEALVEIRDLGYRTVVSTRGAGELDWDEKTAVESLGMTFVHIPMNKPVEEITDEQIRAFTDLMENGERPMVLHCGSGNRVSGLWAVWLVEHEGMSPEAALALAEGAGMTRVRPVVEKRLGKTGGDH